MPQNIDIYPVGVVTAVGAAPNFTDDTWLPCDGSFKNESDYPQLFGAIGYTYGQEPGKFAVPDYRGRFLRGSAEPVGTLQNYATRKPNTAFQGMAYWLPSSQAEMSALPSGACARDAGALDLACCTQGGDKETRPVNVYVEYYIKAKHAVEAAID